MRRRWRRYVQLVPIAVVLWALDAVDKFRAGAQAAGLAHAPAIDHASQALGGHVPIVVNQWTSSHPLARWVATAAQALLRRRVWRIIVWAYPVATTADVVATANHYLLDALAAPAVLGLGYATATALPVLARRARRAQPAPGCVQLARPRASRQGS